MSVLNRVHLVPSWVRNITSWVSWVREERDGREVIKSGTHEQQ